MSAGPRTVAVVRRLLAAPIEAVYDEWLDRAAVTEFITPLPARSGLVEWEPRIGGPFRIEMVDAGNTVTITGEYLEVERPRRLRFTWRSSLGGGFDSLVTVTFEPRDGPATLMTIEHEKLPPAWRADHERGWEQIARQLERVLAG